MRAGAGLTAVGQLDAGSAGSAGSAARVWSVVAGAAGGGAAALREAIASYLGLSRAVRCTPEQVVIVTSTQQAIDLAARLLLDPGDVTKPTKCSLEVRERAVQMVLEHEQDYSSPLVSNFKGLTSTY
jgi:hypothetical protein